jgi:hypothetical protein
MQDEIYDYATSSSTVTYSDVQGASVYPGTGNINAERPFAVQRLLGHAKIDHISLPEDSP